MRVARLVCLLLLVAGAVLAQGAKSIDLEGIDRSVSPTEDFYRFANGKWLDRVDLSPERPVVGVFALLSERNQEVLHEAAEEAAASAPDEPRTDRDRLGLFYRVGMDEDKADKLGIDPIKPELEQIDGIRDGRGVVDQLAALHRIGVKVGFAVGLSADLKDSSHALLEIRQGGLGMPNEQAYLASGPRANAARRRYAGLLIRLFTLSGESSDQADSDTKAVMGLETRLAGVTESAMEAGELENRFHPESVEQVRQDEPNFDWRRYFRDLDISDPDGLNIAQPDFLKLFDSEIGGEPVETWRAYLKGHLLITAAPLLSKPFVEAVFTMAPGSVGSLQVASRWRRVLAVTNGVLGMALGKEYVERNFSPEAKEAATELAMNLKAELRGRIVNLDWMGPETKKEALAKLDAMGLRIGYPDHWPGYDRLEVRNDSFVENFFRASRFEFDRSMSQLGKPVDHSDFPIPPQSGDAFYIPSRNQIVVPAGILQPPFFDPKAPEAQNYGAIGCVIGHEMTHGFDNNGRRFDAQGNLRDWWSPDDSRQFDQRAQALVFQYNDYVVGGDHVSGRQTLAENIADNGGMTISYLAFKRATDGKVQPTIEGFTPDQQFFLAFAQLWRQKILPEAAHAQIEGDVHAPSRFRVIGVLANHPEFWTAFGGDPPKVTNSIW